MPRHYKVCRFFSKIRELINKENVAIARLTLNEYKTRHLFYYILLSHLLEVLQYIENLFPTQNIVNISMKKHWRIA